jgi:hypothetical protein
MAAAVRVLTLFLEGPGSVNQDSGFSHHRFVMALWEAFYIENKRFDLDTLRVPSRSPTPIVKSYDFPGQSDDIWEARSRHFRPILGVPGVRAGFKNTYL